MYPSKSIQKISFSSIAANSDRVDFEKQQKAKDAESRKGFYGFLIKISMTGTAGATATGAAADLVGVINHALKSCTLRYKDDKARPIFQNLSGNDLRKIYSQFLAEKEVANSIIGVSYTKDSDYTLTAQVPVYFRSPKHQARRKRLMGESQFRQLVLELETNDSATVSASAGTFTRKAATAMTIDIVPLATPCRYNAVVAPVCVRRFETATNSFDKLEDGLTLGILEDTAVHASCALTRYQVDVGGRRIMEDATPALVTEQYQRELSTSVDTTAGGVVDVRSLMSVLYAMSKHSVEEDAPHGAPYVEQYNAELSAPKLRQVYYAALSQSDVEVLAGLAAADEKRNLLATRDESASLNSNDAGALALAPVLLIGSDDSRYQDRHGIVASPSGKTTLHINPAVLGRSVATASSIGDKTVAQAFARASQKLQLAQVPGAVDTRGMGVKSSAARQTLRAAHSKIFG